MRRRLLVLLGIVALLGCGYLVVHDVADIGDVPQGTKSDGVQGRAAPETAASVLEAQAIPPEVPQQQIVVSALGILRWRWQEFQASSKSVAEVMAFCEANIPSPEREWCQFEMSQLCQLSRESSGPKLIAEFEQSIRSSKSNEAAEATRQYLERCRAYWQSTTNLHDASAELATRLARANHSAFAMRLATGAVANDWPLEDRREMIRRAWLQKDPDVVGRAEEIALDRVDAARADQEQVARDGRDAVLPLLICTFSGNCDATDSATISALEAVCGNPEAGVSCPPVQSIRQLIRHQLPASEYLLAEAYLADLLGHLDRRDTSWPALQLLLDSLPADANRPSRPPPTAAH